MSPLPLITTIFMFDLSFVARSTHGAKRLHGLAMTGHWTVLCHGSPNAEMSSRADVLLSPARPHNGPPWQARRHRRRERRSAHSTRESGCSGARRAVERVGRHCHHPASPGVRAPPPPCALAIARPRMVRHRSRPGCPAPSKPAKGGSIPDRGKLRRQSAAGAIRSGGRAHRTAHAPAASRSSRTTPPIPNCTAVRSSPTPRRRETSRLRCGR
jgi:hypothetical protein